MLNIHADCRVEKTLMSIAALLAIGVFFCRAALGVENPHWTGKHCAECHSEETLPERLAAGQAPELRFGGDTVQICGRCHRRGSGAGAEVHPVGSRLTERMKQNIPADWPLDDSKTTCLTCHAVRRQMFADLEQKLGDPNFLRSPRPAKLSGFCFNCHPKDRFQKHNPHRLPQGPGRENALPCALCHTDDLAEGMEADFEASLKTKSRLLCIGCHGNLTQGHLVHTYLQVNAQSAKKNELESLAREGIELPLADGRMHCATCHNPHPEGVIGRRAGTAGAGEKYFLRIPKAQDLCVACHAEKASRAPVPAGGLRSASARAASAGTSVHKPRAEKKCKICHSITAEQPQMQALPFFCLGGGCHDPAIFDAKYSHPFSILKDCRGCHDEHSSPFKKLLIAEETQLCRTCHPMLRDKNEQAPIRVEMKNAHDLFTGFFSRSGIEARAGSACVFCHISRHSERAGELSADQCLDCHVSVRETLAAVAGGPLTRHDRFEKSECTDCHDPHGARYPFQLKAPPDKI